MDREQILLESAKLENLGTNLADLDQEAGQFHPRSELLCRLERALAAKHLQPVLLGPHGAGKTTLVTMLARNIERGSTDTPREVRRRQVFRVTSVDMISDAIFASEMENKIGNVVREASRRRAILFLDDVLSFVHAGCGSSNPDADILNLLAPYLRRGCLQIIAAATPEEWQHVCRIRQGFTRMVQAITVPEMTREETLLATRAKAADWDVGHGVRMTPDAVTEVVELSHRLFPWQAWPGKACRLVDVALAMKANESIGPGTSPMLNRRGRNVEVVGRSDVARAIVKATGLAPFLVVPEVAAPEAALSASFSASVVGQTHVTSSLVQRIQMIKARLCEPGRPLASYLFAGPTGVGKTLVARTVAKILLGKESRLVRFDMSEFSTHDAVSRFVGEPFQQGRCFGLVDAILCSPFPVILLDEIEKAHPRVHDVLLQVLGDGRLSDESGRTARFDNAIVMMTCNLGYGSALIEMPVPGETERGWTQRVRDAARQTFRSELLDRMTDVFVFKSLTREEVARVAHREVDRLVRRGALGSRQIRVVLTERAFEAVVEAGYSPQRGAREMERAVERLVGVPLARFLADHPTASHQDVCLDASDGRAHLDVVPGPGCQTLPVREVRVS
jgi:ATP-dependent Clp protease ATP-binding subunit ClpA